MVLESQMSTSSGSRVYSRSRRRSPVRLLTTIVVIGLVGLACWLMIRDPGDGNAQQANGAVASGNDDAANGRGAQASPGNGANPGPSQADPSITPDPGPEQAPPDPPAPQPDPRNQPPVPPPPPPVDPPVNISTPSTSSASVAAKIEEGRRAIQRKDLLTGRTLLNEALGDRGISQDDASTVRRELAAVNEKLIFSPLVVNDDPLVSHYVIQPGQVLSKIAPQYDVPWQFIAKINRIADTRRIRAGQRLKMVRGPFHVVVDKSAFRADVYAQPEAGDRIFIRSFPVGLGEFDSTPIGKFIVKRHSKLEDPEWTNPRTGIRYASRDPKNPVGEHWIGLTGVDENTKLMRGYGLHGTIEPKSIGKEASMGCVRLLPDDIAMLFTMLIETKSTVTIVP